MLFGPLLLYEVLRAARRRRHFLFRSLYGVSLLLLLHWCALASSPVGRGGSARALSVLGESFFYTFMWVQLLAVALLTPAYTAGAIAEEKARKTLEFLQETWKDKPEMA